jgi:hypothetical protein
VTNRSEAATQFEEGVLVLAIASVFGIPWIRLTLSTVSADAAYVNGHVTFVAACVSGQIAWVLVDDDNRVHSDAVTLVKLLRAGERHDEFLVAGTASGGDPLSIPPRQRALPLEHEKSPRQLNRATSDPGVAGSADPFSRRRRSVSLSLSPLAERED